LRYAVIVKVAVTADWLVTYGGAEHVLAEFHALYPDAPFFTTVARKQALGPLKNADIRTSGLQKWYNLIKQHQILLPWMPRALEDMDVRGFQVLISSSHAVGKGIIAPPGTLHVCYCHTPMRYAWEMEEEYLRDFNVPKLIRGRVKRELSKLRRWDMTSAQRVDLFIANSTTTQERIRRLYARDSIVIPPPVGDRFLHPHPNPLPQTGEGGPEDRVRGYFLAVGRLVPYKRFDLLIDLANALKLPLKIAGRGQDEARLKRMAGPTVEFLGFIPDDELPSLYANAEALFFPQYEDAGIVLLEAQACGTPVIAYRAGGAMDAVVEGKTGIFFADQTTDSLSQALERFRTMTWDRANIRAHAAKFSQEAFRRKMQQAVNGAYEEFKTGKFARR